MPLGRCAQARPSTDTIGRRPRRSQSSGSGPVDRTGIRPGDRQGIGGFPRQGTLGGPKEVCMPNPPSFLVRKLLGKRHETLYGRGAQESAIVARQSDLPHRAMLPSTRRGLARLLEMLRSMEPGTVAAEWHPGPCFSCIVLAVAGHAARLGERCPERQMSRALGWRAAWHCHKLRYLHAGASGPASRFDRGHRQLRKPRWDDMLQATANHHQPNRGGSMADRGARSRQVERVREVFHSSRDVHHRVAADRHAMRTTRDRRARLPRKGRVDAKPAPTY